MSGEYDNTRTRSPSLEPSETTPLNTAYGLPTQEEVSLYPLQCGL